MNKKRVTKGQVITRYGAEILVEIEDNQQVVRCTAKRKLDHVACGDFVTISLAEHGNAQLQSIEPRHNALMRPDYSHKLKTIAANIDQLIIVIAWRPKPSWSLIDRYLIASQRLNCDALIIINKADLYEQYASAEARLRLDEFKQIGYPIISASAGDADEVTGITELQKYLHNKTSTLVGQSGVGKSSLANEILKDANIQVGAISDNGEGRHTTTSTRLYKLNAGGKLIDSPGVRDFALPELTAQQLRAGYIEFNDASLSCKFNNCSHQHEPKCAVRQQLADNKIPSERYQRYLKLLATLD
ncbi:MAG: ribosome small subunit-dependent GTPase A [Thiotrichaceae bacterium]|nr:ribosome small subunit-dependent GTPase A [Thiotrichaceae bacterium]